MEKDEMENAPPQILAAFGSEAQTEYEQLSLWEAEAELRVNTDEDCDTESDTDDQAIDIDSDTDTDEGWTDEEIRRQAWWDSARSATRQAFQAQQFLVSALRRFAYEDAVSEGRNPEEVLAERLGIDPDEWKAGLALMAEIAPDLAREDHTDILPLDWDSKESPRFRHFQTWVETCVRRRGVYPARSRNRDLTEMGFGEIPERYKHQVTADPTRRDSEHELLDLDAYGAIPESSGPWFWSQPHSVTNWPHSRTIATIKTVEQHVGTPIRRALRSEVSWLLRERQGVLDFKIVTRDETKYRQQAIADVAQIREAWDMAWHQDPIEALHGSRALRQLRRKHLGSDSGIQLWERVDQETRIPLTRDRQGQWIQRPELALNRRLIRAIWRKAHNKIRTPIGIVWIRNTAFSTDLRATLMKAIPASYQGPKRWAVQAYFDCVASGHATL